MNAKPCLFNLAMIILLGTAATAQVVPTTPTKFAKRGVGSSTTAGSTGISQTGGNSASTGVSNAKPEPLIRTITYITLSGARQWTSTEGKPMLAKLIAFEDVTTESKSAPTATSQSPITGKPTVVRDGKVRFLMDNKAYEVALDKLSQADQEFVRTIKRAVEATK